MRKFNKKAAVVAGGMAVAVVGAGIGYGYWSTTGSGSSTAATGTSSPFEVTVAAKSGNVAMSPGGAIDTYTYTVKNNNDGHQNFNQVQIKVANSDGTAWTVKDSNNNVICSAADYSVNGALAGATSTDATQAADLAHNGTASNDFTVQMVNASSNQDGCKSVTVPLYVSAS